MNFCLPVFVKTTTRQADFHGFVRIQELCSFLSILFSIRVYHYFHCQKPTYSIYVLFIVCVNLVSVMWLFFIFFYFFNSLNMPSSIKFCGKPYFYNISCLLLGNESSLKNKDICIVMLSG